MFSAKIEIPFEKKEKISNLFKSLENEESITSLFKSTNYEDVKFFISEDGNRLISLEPENLISISFNPKNLSDETMLKTQEEVMNVLSLIKKKYDYHHLHQEIHMHLNDVKLKFNPFNLINEKELKKEVTGRPVEVGMVGLKFSEKGQVNTKITFYKNNTLGIVFTDFDSSKINFIEIRNKIDEILKFILEK